MSRNGLILPRDPVPLPDHLTLGLRFSKSQARVLRNVADDLRSRRPKGIDIALFDKAADSADAGEPLVVACSHPDEVREMARMFATLGIKEPTIEDLNG